MINQCIVSTSLPWLVSGFHKRLGCGYNYHPDNPTYFVGLYSHNDYDRVVSHRGLAVVVFCGSDAFKLKSRGFYKQFMVISRKPNVRVVSISKDIQQVLDDAGIPNVLYNVCPTQEDRFEVTKPTTNKVYIYYNKAHFDLFDWGLYHSLREHYKDEKVVIPDVEKRVFVNPLDMGKVYSECFVGMKPYLSDGYGNTQVELALSGRRCISNGDFVGNLRYGSVDDVIAHIERELKDVNDVRGRVELRNLALSELQLPYGFNEIEFWI